MLNYKIWLFETNYKEVVQASIDPPVYAKNLTQIVLRQQIACYTVNQIFNLNQRDQLEQKIKDRKEASMTAIVVSTYNFWKYNCKLLDNISQQRQNLIVQRDNGELKSNGST